MVCRRRQFRVSGDFQDPISSFSIDFARGDGSDVTNSLHIKLFDDLGQQLVQLNWGLSPIGVWDTIVLDSIIAGIPAAVMGVSILYPTAGSPNMGFDNMTMVPLPATLLLLGSGLVTVVFRRKTGLAHAE